MFGINPSFGPAIIRVEDMNSQAPDLPEKERASLASRPLRSLPPVALEKDEGVAEALRRNAELDADPSQAMTLRDLHSHVQHRRKA